MKKYLVPTAAGTLALAGLVLFTPRAHALVATLVQVVNTVQNPAVTMDGSHFASQLVLLRPSFGGQLVGGTSSDMHQALPGGLAPTAYIVPAGQNLVITDLDFSVSSSVSDTNVILYPGPGGTGAPQGYYFMPTAGTYQFHARSGTVFPAGSNVSLYSKAADGSLMEVVIRGYLTAN